jgi:hypothetical protein
LGRTQKGGNAGRLLTPNKTLKPLRLPQGLKVGVPLFSPSTALSRKDGTQGNEYDEGKNLKGKAGLHYVQSLVFKWEVFGQADHGSAAGLEKEGDEVTVVVLPLVARPCGTAWDLVAEGHSGLYHTR